MAQTWLSADGIAFHPGVNNDIAHTGIAEKDTPAHEIRRLWKFQAGQFDDWVRRGSASASTRDADAE